MSFPQTLTLKAFAKINLSLDITGILENGYHQLEMIMQSVSLHDKVTITTSDASQGISLSCSVPSLCPNEQNTAYKAANFLNSAESVLLFPFILKNRFPVRQVWPEEARMQPLYCMD